MRGLSDPQRSFVRLEVSNRSDMDRVAIAALYFPVKVPGEPNTHYSRTYFHFGTRTAAYMGTSTWIQHYKAPYKRE